MNLFAVQLVLLVLGLSGAQCQTTNESSFRNYENLTGIDDLVQLYDIHVLGAKWTEINVQLGRQCARDMTEYFNGLEKKASWAIKMDDSTGHYSAGYLWGNNFWTGSMTLCRSIYRYDETRLKKQIGHTGLGLVRGNMENYDDVHLNSPFVPHFGVVKFVLKEVFTTPNPRTVHIGVCFPSSCNASDLSHLAESAGRKTASKTVTVIDARIPNGSGVSLWNDWIFILMLTITVIVGLLITAGTVFDYQLKKKIKIETERKRNSKEAISESSGVNCTTYDLTQTVNGKESGGGMDICIPSGLGINNNGHLPMKPVTSRPTRELSLGEEFLMSFSLTSNFEAICSRDVGDDTVSCIHGIRAISMCWIILGHTCYIGLNFADNSELRKVVEHQFVFQTIINGVYSVDTFFFISGFLVVFLYLRNNAKGNLDRLSQGVNEFTSTALHFCGLTSYRLARLTAPYLYMIGVTYVVMKYLADNMVFVPPGQDYINCPKYWWRNMLYINTFYPVQDMCMIWSWYLSNDTQFFIAGAIVLIIGVRHFKFATAALTLFLLSSWITTGVIDYSTETSDRFEFFDKIYDKPWTRFGPYLVGMAVGWILFKTNFKVQMSKFQKLLGWFISLSTLFVLVYGLYKIEMSKEVAAVHSALSHTLWALGLAWVVIACATGNGGFINGLLSASCLYPFSRVTYCVYLVHPVVIRTFVVSSDTPFHLDEVSTLFIFFGQIGASYLASFAVSLGFEAPVCSLLRVMSKRSSRVISTN